MKQFLVTVAGVFAGLLLFFVGLPFLLVMIAVGASQPSVSPGPSVLQLDLRSGLTDQDPQSPFAGFRSRTLSVMSIVQTLHRAEKDDKVKAVLVRLPDGGIAPAAADELRLAFKAFRASGKPMIAHSQGLYPAGAITSTYMLGASTGQLWMQPGASFQAVGMASDDIFFKRFFDKYAIKPQFEQRYEFKNAINPFLYDDYTPAHRLATLSWMGSVYQSALGAAAADRRINPASLRTVIEAGPYDAADALRKGLIDKVGQVKEAQDAALKAAGSGAKLVDFEDYQSASTRRVGPALGDGATIAVVNAEGDIITGTDEAKSPFGDGQTIYSDDISKALYDAAADKDVKAIVFRVSSPGGSDTASEQILAAVRAAKAAGKPVVVSMGTYGASGGYWISSEASAIVAEPTTLTGSIGVFGGKIALGDALGRFGVDMRQIGVGGGYAGVDSPAATFTPQQRAAFAASVDKVYDGFIQRVARGRHLTPDRVREIAKGRVWTGVQAKQLGLVDEVGGFYQAVDKAKALAGLTGKATRLKTLPAKKSPFEALQRAFGVSTDSARTMAAAAWIFGDPRAQRIMDEMMQARLRSQGALVLAPKAVD